MDRKEPQVLIDKIARHTAFRELEKKIGDGVFPIDLAEAENSFLALVVAALRKKTGKPFFIVLPTDHEAEDFSTDLGFFGVDSRLLPWWNTAAYRPAAVRSRVFGERASIFADLAGKASGVIVASHRAFITPAPPKEYFAKTLIHLRLGQAFQPEAVADRLGEYGYLRVPRVALPGEFAQRGEVLDVFMPGDSQALRIQFSYDSIEKITRFDANSQSGHERIDSCIVRPLKEVVWNKTLAALVSQKGEGYPGCRGRLGPMEEA